MNRVSRWGTHRPAPRQDLRWDSPEATRWDVLNIGYDAGIRDALRRGIEIGRAQVEAEHAALWREVQLTCDAIANRPGPLGHTAREKWLRQRADQLDHDPGLTGEQLREKAAKSWGMPYRPLRAIREAGTPPSRAEAA
ncbi:hypothetical protein [Kineosporia sp. NBRC 101731]|uniref:hypothetical protein n=1 Tax=Kineosporia sp. NBRC 101731 TaxID=3032199 RepID=UPI0024A50B23|nr:hypothetical protein [Kineosporia sp. NBRC 101731]GLY33554.1 hypothetical protein Kisp02_69190 [Kineosporia sp. NBRC 101731]